MFKKYNSLTNHVDKGFLNKLMIQGFTDPLKTWVAREKVHGANFSFIIKNDEIKIAKRTGIIEEQETFYEASDLLKKYRESVIKVRDSLNLLKKLNPDSTVTIFGEYAGKQKTGGNIQHGVEYGDADFYAFDIMIDGEYVDEVVFITAISVSEFKEAPMIALGSFDQLIAINPNFDSVVTETQEQKYQRLKDAVKRVDNYGLRYTNINTAEGLVIKPIFSKMMGEHRVIVKIKNEKFSERKNRVKNFVPPVPLTEKDKEVLEELVTYITDNRTRNVLSKIGIPTAKQFGTVMGLTVQDILKESNGYIENSENVSVVKKALVVEVTNALRDNWIKILRGDF